MLAVTSVCYAARTHLRAIEHLALEYLCVRVFGVTVDFAESKNARLCVVSSTLNFRVTTQFYIYYRGGSYLKVPGDYVMKNILPSGGLACQVVVRLGGSYFVTVQ